MRVIRTTGVCLLLSAVLLASGCSGSGEAAQAEEPLEHIKVRYILGPSPESAYLLIAQEQGFFKKHGLDVELLSSNQPTDGLKTVDAGADDFGVAYPEDILMAREMGLSLVGVVGVAQRNETGYVSVNPEITSPEDFPGHLVGLTTVPSLNARYETMVKEAGLDSGTWETFDAGLSAYPLILAGKLDCCVVLEYLGVPVIEEAGGEITGLWHFYDYGAPEGYGHVLFTNEELLKERPGVVRSFAAAVTEAMQFVIDNPQETGRIFHELQPEVAASTVARTSELAAPVFSSDDTRAHGLGWMSEVKLREIHDWMRESELLADDLDVDEAFTNEYLPGKE